MEGISPQGSRNLGLQILLSAVCLSALTTLSVAADLSPYYLENRTMISAPTPAPHQTQQRKVTPPQSYPDPTQDSDFQPLPEKQNGPGHGQGQGGGGQAGGGQAGGGQGGGGQALVLNASQKRLIRRYPLMLNQCFRLVSSPQRGKS